MTARGRRIGLPYARATDALRLVRWSAGPAGRVESEPELLADWDPSQDLNIACAVEIDQAALRAETQLPPEAEIALHLTVDCERTRFRAESPTVELGAKGSASHELTLTVSGREISAQITVGVAAVLLSTPKSRAACHATIPGSVLWQDERKLLLDDAAARFPTQWIDFTAAGSAATAGWVLEWDPHDLDLSVYGGIRLLLNANDSRVKRAIESQADDEAARTLRAWIRADVARQLVFGALRNQDFLEREAGYEEGTIGAVVARLVALCFPHDPSASAVRRKLDTQPLRVEAQILSLFGVPEGAS